MKLKTREIDSFVKSPAPAARVILVYGPDSGLVRERAEKLGLSIVSDLNDPFNAVTLTADQLSEDPARLSDEASALSMMGGGRLVRIRDAGDKLTPLLKDYLQNPSMENLIVMEAGELGPRSPLRQLCEKAQNAAAVPCYVENERDLAGLIRETLRHAGYTAAPDAVAWLSTNLVGDRMRARAELDKLVTYMGPAPGYEGPSGPPVTENLGTVALTDVQACSGSGREESLDDLVYSIAGAQPQVTLKNYATLLEEGYPPVAMLRALQNHFRRLHLTKSHMATGLPLPEAMKKLQPPVFFKYEADFRAQLQRWPAPALEQVLNRLADLEAQTKRTGTPVETLCAQAFLSLSRR